LILLVALETIVDNECWLVNIHVRLLGLILFKLSSLGLRFGLGAGRSVMRLSLRLRLGLGLGLGLVGSLLISLFGVAQLFVFS
jgi:hypothetical protein